MPLRWYLRRERGATGKAMETPLAVLGLESSCDDTAAAIVRFEGPGRASALSSIVRGQADLHAAFGGVVPEIAARAHAEKLDSVAREALREAGTDLEGIDLIAVTAGPGLIGGVMSGVMFAKGLSAALERPLIGVNHLIGHVLTPRLTDGLDYPYVALLASGGHCQLVLARGCDDFTRIGGTVDDAPGEAFDKIARVLDLPQPGGPSIEREAAGGDPQRHRFPRPLLDRPGCDMSFSGLKTAALRALERIVSERGGLTRQDRADICAGFQAAVAGVLVEKTRRAMEAAAQMTGLRPALAVAGGVAANAAVRAGLKEAAARIGSAFLAPPLALCTDNAAMIAYTGGELHAAGRRDDMTLAARSRWPLDSSSPAMLGGGKRGAKA